MRTKLIYVACALYVVSLILPSLIVYGPMTTSVVPGWELLIFGWLSLYNYTFSWLANALLAGGLLFGFAKEYKFAIPLSIAALVLALQMFVVETVPTPGSSGADGTFVLTFGYYAWVAAMLVLFLHSYLNLRKK